jgi:hypothetical protein
LLNVRTWLKPTENPMIQRGPKLTTLRNLSIWLSLLLASGFFGGCRSIGSRELTGTHAAYNQAIATNLDRQLLQNLVRLRYRDNPYFLEVGSVTASLTLEASVGTDSEINTGPGGNIFMPNASVAYSTGPTISYSPLQGEDFLRNVLTPISIDSLFILMNSGWSAKRVFGVAVERINDLENAPTASGPTPTIAPPNQTPFLRFLELLERKRAAGIIQSRIDPESGALSIYFDNSAVVSEVTEIRNLLNLNQELNVFQVDGEFFTPSSDTISIRTRSIMSILFYLSQNVQIPIKDEARGLVTLTQSPGGGTYDWGKTAAGSLFSVLVTDKEPKDAFLSVPYRGHWFYIDDTDLDSKSSFLLLSQLFNLQAGSISRPGPTLTIPVSR